MNKAQLDQIEKEIRKTKHVFPKSKLNSARVKSVIAFVKTMSDEELAMFLVQFIANCALFILSILFFFYLFRKTQSRIFFMSDSFTLGDNSTDQSDLSFQS